MVLQVILVVIVIFWPGSVTYWLSRGTGVDPSKIRIEIPMPDAPPPLDFGPPPSETMSQESRGAETPRPVVIGIARCQARVRMRIMKLS